MKEFISELLEVHASGTDYSNSDLTDPDLLCSEFDRPDKKKAVIEKQTSLCNEF